MDSTVLLMLGALEVGAVEGAFWMLWFVFSLCVFRSVGKADGHKEGRAIGYAEGKADALKEMLEKKAQEAGAEKK